MKKKLIVLFVLSSFMLILGAMPFMALAQVQDAPPAPTCSQFDYGTIQKIICAFGDIFNLAVPILIALGILYFIWGVVTYVIAGDEEAKKKGRDKIVFGL